MQGLLQDGNRQIQCFGQRFQFPAADIFGSAGLDKVNILLVDSPRPIRQLLSGEAPLSAKLFQPGAKREGFIHPFKILKTLGRVRPVSSNFVAGQFLI